VLEKKMSIFFYLDKDSFLHRLDPRVKIFGLIFIFVFVALVNRLTGLLCIFAGLIFLFVLAKSLGNLQKMAALFFLIGITSFILWTIFYRGHEKIHVFGNFYIYRDALSYATLMGLRFVNMLLAGLLFLSIISLEDLSGGLIMLGVPYGVAFAISLSFRLVIVFVSTGFTIVEAQKVRGNNVEEGHILKRIKSYAPLLIPLILNGLKRAETLRVALESKGFSPKNKVRIREKYQMRAADWLAFAGCLAVLVVLVFLKINAS
jgi:energy-coupling factor transport system permease protein